MDILEVQNLSMAYESRTGRTQAIEDITLSVKRNEVLGIVGPSGAGKTTLLKCLSGLLAPTGGEVRLLGRLVKSPPKELAMVFQDYSRSLLPWLTVQANVEMPLKCQGVEPRTIRERSNEFIRAVGLEGKEEVYPWQLSGGMQQRVAIARGLAFQPEVLLLDEPFGSLDAQTRSELEDLVFDIRKRYQTTIVLVTHDIDEAVYLCDRVAVLSKAPSTVREILDIDLSIRGDQIASKALPEFISARARIIGLIKGAQPSAQVI